MKYLGKLLECLIFGGFAALQGACMVLMFGAIICIPLFFIALLVWWLFSLPTEYIESVQFSILLLKICGFISLFIMIVAFINTSYVIMTGKDNWFSAMCLTQDKKS